MEEPLFYFGAPTSDEDPIRRGIGTLGEKTVHAMLKRYYEPDASLHEVSCRGFVADILSGNRIIEIQSRGFERLVPKLIALLEDYDITVVFPVVVKKEIVWVDPETGECRKPRISNKHGHELDLFSELYRIREFLDHRHLHFRVVKINAREYRLTNGQGAQKKKHATKVDILPLSILGEINVESPRDYACFLPSSLPSVFTADLLRDKTGASLLAARMALRVMREHGTVIYKGKERHRNLYSL